LAAGLAGGLLFAQHAALLAALAFLAGVAATIVTHKLRRVAGAAAERAGAEHDAHLRLADAKVETEQARAGELDARAAHRRRTRGEQDAAVKRAYDRGAVDAIDWHAEAAKGRRR
jgi:hypothetical protein